MVLSQKTRTITVAALLLIAGVRATAQAQFADVGPAIGASGNSQIEIKGDVMCINCSLDQARKAFPNEPGLYQLTTKQGQIVMRVYWTNNQSRWERVILTPHVWVRGEEKTLQALNTQANMFKELEIHGVLNNSHTLDVITITVNG
jgi:hypothetical protein